MAMPQVRPLPDLQTLLGAVRRRLWRAQFVAGARLALWGSAGLMLLAAAVHLAGRPLPASAVGSAFAVLWLALLAWAGWRRPGDSACALWADRQLGGASAFATLLEVGNGTQAAADPQAVRWLEQWAAARLPDGLRRLAERPAATRLLRPLLAMLVCTALASLVLTLPEPAPAAATAAATPPRAAPPAAPGSADPATALADAPATAELADQVASALRSAPSRDAAARREAGTTPAAGPGRTDDGTAAPPAAAGAAPADARSAAADASAATAIDAAASAASAQAAGAGSGREAGESRDDRAELGVSPAPPGTLAVQRSAARGRRPSAERQADPDRQADYDDEPSARAAAAPPAEPAAVAAAAATPPPVTPTARLTATETSYVQAWMKASAQRR